MESGRHTSSTAEISHPEEVVNNGGVPLLETDVVKRSGCTKVAEFVAWVMGIRTPVIRAVRNRKETRCSLPSSVLSFEGVGYLVNWV